MHIGVCYRDLPLRPAYCRNPLVSRSRQVMSFLFWGGSMVLRQMFQIGRWKLFIAHVFLVFFSADEEKKHVYALECFVDVWFFSLLRFGASSMCNFLSSLDISAQLLLRMMSAQLMSLTTSTSIDTIARKVHVIAETCQMTMNYVILR